MIRRLIFGRYKLVSFLSSLFFVLFFATFNQASTTKSSSARILLQKARICTKELYQSRVKKKYRHNWEKCLKKYERVYKAFPDTDEAVHAMFSAGQIWTNLYGYSSRSSDIDRAVSIYRELVKRYKAHNYPLDFFAISSKSH